MKLEEVLEYRNKTKRQLECEISKMLKIDEPVNENRSDRRVWLIRVHRELKRFK